MTDELTKTDDVHPIKFVRKRAYASARHSRRNAHRLSSQAVNAHSNTIVNRNPSLNSSSTISCQLLPAFNLKKSPIINGSLLSNQSSPLEPKLIHLPRRKSSNLIKQSKIGDYSIDLSNDVTPKTYHHLSSMKSNLFNLS